MQITARKPRLSAMNVKYVAAALGIVGALAAGVTTYTLTRNDSQASQPVVAESAVTADYLEQAAAHEGAYSEVPDGSDSRETLRPALREGFQPNGPGDEFTGSSPKARGVPSVTTRDDITAHTPFGAGEGFIGGNETADLSPVASEGNPSDAGMLDEEYTQQNPGAETSDRPSLRQSTPLNGGFVP